MADSFRWRQFCPQKVSNGEAKLDAALVADAFAELRLAHSAVWRHTYTGAHFVHILIGICRAFCFIDSFGGIQQYFSVAEDGAGMCVCGRALECYSGISLCSTRSGFHHAIHGNPYPNHK